MLLNLLSVLPFVPVFVIACRRASRGIWDTTTGACIGVLGVGGIIGLFWQHRRHSRYVCPDCGKRIIDRHKDARPGDPIDFYCDVCDVEWVTGLSASDIDA